MISHTGVAGLTLGGGMGRLSRAFEAIGALDELADLDRANALSHSP